MVYLTRLRAKPPNASWPWGAHCRMFADTVDEAIRFAAMLGVGSTWLCWAQDSPPYFNIAPSRRNMALGMGAVEATPQIEEDFAQRAQAGEWRCLGTRAA